MKQHKQLLIDQSSLTKGTLKLITWIENIIKQHHGFKLASIKKNLVMEKNNENIDNDTKKDKKLNKTGEFLKATNFGADIPINNLNKEITSTSRKLALIGPDIQNILKDNFNNNEL